MERVERALPKNNGVDPFANNNVMGECEGVRWSEYNFRDAEEIVTKEKRGKEKWSSNRFV